jgi:tetratricopeptide (TPR) repeat protein
MKRVLFLLIPFFSLVACKTTDTVYLKSQLRQAMLTGKVITDEGLPLEGVTVSLNDLQVTKTDINGKFLFNFIKYGKYTITFSRKDYSKKTVPMVYNFKNRKLPVISVKLFSSNFLLSEAFEYLKENDFSNALDTIETVYEINPGDETARYLECMYLVQQNRHEEALKIAEDLKRHDRHNIYYQLTLCSIYRQLEMFEQLAARYEYMGRSDLRNNSDYIVKAAEVYRIDLQDNSEYDRVTEEYPELFTDGIDN